MRTSWTAHSNCFPSLSQRLKERENVKRPWKSWPQHTNFKPDQKARKLRRRSEEREREKTKIKMTTTTSTTNGRSNHNGTSKEKWKKMAWIEKSFWICLFVCLCVYVCVMRWHHNRNMLWNRFIPSNERKLHIECPLPRRRHRSKARLLLGSQATYFSWLFLDFHENVFVYIKCNTNNVRHV